MKCNGLVLCVMTAVVAIGAPSMAAAQTSTPSGPNSGGPMTVEQVTQHFAIAPEVKASDFDGKTGVFVGAHGGVLVGNRFLVGAGLYTLTNGSRGRGLTYGGGMVGWQWWNGGLFSGSVRSLIGVGSGTTSQDLTLTDRRGRTFESERFLSSDFFVAEPQGDVLVRLTKHLHLDVGAGYRFASGGRVDNNRFSGASGSLALRIGSAQ